MTKFYILYSPEGEAPPKVQHATHKEALKIAHMMAARYPGQSFYVMGQASAAALVNLETADALTRMTEADEEMEVEHPGWMEGRVALTRAFSNMLDTLSPPSIPVEE